jgi:translation initiation factor IF-3
LRTNYKKQKNRLFYILNDKIVASTLRLIDDKGKQIGIISREDCFRLAQEKSLDLVLIAEHANPPVAKLIDFKKFLYQEKKKQKEARKGIKKSIIKDIKLSLFIGRSDFERLINKTKLFLKDGHQVRIGLLLKGREMGKKPMAFAIVNRFINLVDDITISVPPKIQGRVIITVIGRKK